MQLSTLLYLGHLPFLYCAVQSDGVTIDLAGETIGVRADALVNTPLEPRLFIYRRDGSALELLRNEDAQKWCERLSHLSPSQPRRQQSDGAGRRSTGGATSGVDVLEHECSSDPHSQATRQVGRCGTQSEGWVRWGRHMYPVVHADVADGKVDKFFVSSMK